MLCVESPQVQYIDLSELIHVLKAYVAIVTSKHLNSATIFVVSSFLIAKVTPGWRLNSGFWNLNYCPFPLNKDVPSKEVTISKII